jgi:hypothetical protein
LTRLEANTDELCLVGVSPYAEIRLKSEAVRSFSLDDGPLETGNDAFWIRCTFATNEADDARSVCCVFRVAYLNRAQETHDLARRLAVVLGLRFFRVQPNRVEACRHQPQIIGSPFRGHADGWEPIGELNTAADYVKSEMTPEGFSSPEVDEELLERVLRKPPEGSSQLTSWLSPSRIIGRQPETGGTRRWHYAWFTHVVKALLSFVGYVIGGYFAVATLGYCLIILISIVAERAFLDDVPHLQDWVGYTSLLIGVAYGVHGASKKWQDREVPVEPARYTKIHLEEQKLYLGTHRDEQALSLDAIESIRFDDFHHSVKVSLNTSRGTATLFEWKTWSTDDDGEHLKGLARSLARQLAEKLGRPIELHDYRG